ncbi:unnamed protein product, partial [Mesorhabditis spiculigera]
MADGIFGKKAISQGRVRLKAAWLSFLGQFGLGKTYVGISYKVDGKRKYWYTPSVPVEHQVLLKKARTSTGGYEISFNTHKGPFHYTSTEENMIATYLVVRDPAIVGVKHHRAGKQPISMMLTRGKDTPRPPVEHVLKRIRDWESVKAQPFKAPLRREFSVGPGNNYWTIDQTWRRKRINQNQVKLKADWLSFKGKFGVGETKVGIAWNVPGGAQGRERRCWFSENTPLAVQIKFQSDLDKMEQEEKDPNRRRLRYETDREQADDEHLQIFTLDQQ